MLNLKKEEIENLSYKDITNMILETEEKGLNTLDLFTAIVDALDLPYSTITSKIGDYYTSLTTDKRFVLIDGKWDLRKRHTSDKVIVKVEEDEDEIIEDPREDEVIDEDEVENIDNEDEIEDDSFDDNDEDLSDLVVLDEDEIESEQ